MTMIALAFMINDESSSAPIFDNDKAQALRVLLKAMMQSLLN